MENSCQCSLSTTDVVPRQEKLLVPRHQFRVQRIALGGLGSSIGQEDLELLVEVLILLRGFRLHGPALQETWPCTLVVLQKTWEVSPSPQCFDVELARVMAWVLPRDSELLPRLFTTIRVSLVSSVARSSATVPSVHRKSERMLRYRAQTRNESNSVMTGYDTMTGLNLGVPT